MGTTGSRGDRAPQAERDAAAAAKKRKSGRPPELASSKSSRGADPLLERKYQNPGRLQSLHMRTHAHIRTRACIQARIHVHTRPLMRTRAT